MTGIGTLMESVGGIEPHRFILPRFGTEQKILSK